MRLRLQFPNGLPAFESHRDFSLESNASTAPLFELRSHTDDLSFYLIPVALLDPHYRMQLSESDRAALGSEESHKLLTLAVLTASDESPTANLLAPIVVDLATNRAVQAVRDDALYSHQHALLRTEPSCS